MRLYSYLFFALTICSFTNCRKENIAKPIKEDYIVISKEDSISKTYNKTNKIPKPIIPQEMKWYSDLVFIMDSKDKVYVYQTEKKSSNENAKFDYPNYIGLRPEYLTTIESKDFISFLKNNNDIFGIFPNQENVSNFFYIVSETDTIKNQALYDLNKVLNKEKSRSIYLLRKTTEEENEVLKFKRSHQNFEPKNIKWSTKFYNGHLIPFTKEYDEFEKKINSDVKAKETFKKKIRMIYM
jgi:hypothetical protein